MTDHEIKAIMERVAQMHADVVRLGEALLREIDEPVHRPKDGKFAWVGECEE